MNAWTVVEAPAESLVEIEAISIAFRVEQRYEVTGSSPAASESLLRASAVDEPYVKDYDAIPGNHPRDWLATFDVSNWALLWACDGLERIGAIVLAHRSPELDLLEGRNDLALIWDLRVASAYRRRGVGTALMTAAVDWARARGCGLLKVETQDTNVPACRFYAAQGFALGGIDPTAYPELPNETQLIWYRALDATGRDR